MHTPAADSISPVENKQVSFLYRAWPSNWSSPGGLLTDVPNTEGTDSVVSSWRTSGITGSRGSVTVVAAQLLVSAYARVCVCIYIRLRTLQGGCHAAVGKCLCLCVCKKHGCVHCKVVTTRLLVSAYACVYVRSMAVYTARWLPRSCW